MSKCKPNRDEFQLTMRRACTAARDDNDATSESETCAAGLGPRHGPRLQFTNPVLPSGLSYVLSLVLVIDVHLVSVLANTVFT